MGRVRSGVLDGRIVTVAWLALVPVVGGFVFLRSAPTRAAFNWAQIVFLVPIAFGAAAAEFAYLVGPRGTERKAWGLLSLTVVILLGAEAYYSWYQVAVSATGPPSPSLFDALNMLAAAIIAATLVMLSGVLRENWARRLRLACDVIALASVAYVGLYHVWTKTLTPSAGWVEIARWNAYSLGGIVLIGGMLWLASSGIGESQREVAALTGTSLLIFGIGMVLWPLWRVGGAGSAAMLDVLVSAVYLLGYYLLMMAGLVRLRDSELSWSDMAIRPLGVNDVWSATVISSVVLASVIAIAVWCYTAPAPSLELVPYIACGMLATLALIGRTGVTAIETALLRQQADIDPLTGLRNSGACRSALDQALESATRLGLPISVIVLDLDDFARINEGLGQMAGDAILVDVARALTQAIGRQGELFHLEADEFAVIVRESRDQAALVAANLLRSIEEIRPTGSLRVSASIGLAELTEGLDGGEELFRQAAAAESWAKYHGKGRVVVFDERILRALGVEDRLKDVREDAAARLVRALCAAADARDQRNYYHSRNTAALAVILCETLGLERERVQRIEIAALLHDCGKLCLADDLLADRLLTSRQQLALREHAELGGALTASLGLDGVSEWILHHHERWDGAGYPDGLSGDRVMLESRILALADAYDAMTSGMRNRAPLSRPAALQEIDLGMGSRFDPELAELFINAVGATRSLGWSDEWSVM